ncbi:MAG: 1-acyl-sn-glycerol-3-phosphate acyltransferase [Ferruginibacter sp.]|nr:1-acyl-sn-glycerol-3-phosphate acyltransferase [Ferruginibacter sp.]
MIYSMYAFIIFVSVMLLLFPAVIVAFFMGRIRGGNLVYDLCRLWADIAFVCWGFRHRNIYEAQPLRNRPTVFVFNHVSFMDIPVMMKTFRKQHIRILGKAEMAKIPLFGFLYKQAVVMVDRSSAAARAKSLHELKEVLQHNISVVIAPEGTFNTTRQPLKSFYDGAFRLAIETQTPVQPVLILDTYDRMHYASVFSMTPGRSRSVYLDPVEVSGLTLEDVKMLKDTVYHIMEQGLIRYQASWIKQPAHAGA